MRNKEHKVLATNTIMLYVLTLSNYVFSLLTVPYQTRVLGPELYGIIGFAIATTNYFQMIFDFGFNISATAEVASTRTDKKKLSIILESITIAKFILFLICSLIFIGLLVLIPQMKKYSLVFIIYFFYTFANSMVPDYLYRGMECMKPITYRTILIKLFFTLNIFALVKKQSDYILIPLLYFIGSLIAVLYSWIDAKKRFGLSFVPIQTGDIFNRIKLSFPFFVSRIASTIYGATNTFLLGIRFSGQNTLGFYTSSDKVVTLARMGATPISDSLYPYLIKNNDFKLVKTVLKYLMPIIIISGFILYIFAEKFCLIVFGKDYVNASFALRALIPVMILVLPSYIYGFPMMTPLHIEKYANYSVILGAIIQICLIIFLYISGLFSVVSVCIVTSITEFSVFFYRYIIVNKALKKINIK